MKQRVVITGMGAITPVGNSTKELWQSLIEGKSGISLITRFDASDCAVKIAGEVKGFDPSLYMDKKEAKRMDRFTQLAVAASKMAMDDAKIDLEKEDLKRFGTLIGSGIGGMETIHDNFKTLFDKGPGRVSPLFIPMMISNMAAGQVSIMYGLQGPSCSISTACATSTDAIGTAMRYLQAGDVDVMLAGGSESTISPIAVGGFNNMKALSTRNDEPEKASRPFDIDRDGFVMSEGAGVLLLETLEHAKARGAHIYAEVVGYGHNSDAYHITAPAPEGEMAAVCMEMALRDGGVDVNEVDYINAHGTSTPLNDRNETQAIKKVFGEHAYKLKVSSTKSMTGHLLGAAGAVEAIISVFAINNGVIPPTINLHNTEPEMDLDYVPNKAVQHKVKVAISNSFGFGGHNATIAVKKFVE